MGKKIIKGSKRGLTFSFIGEENFEPGKKYRYIVNLKEQLIVIVPSADGNQVSKKRCGKEVKSLIDIRSREVRDMVSRAEIMEIDICEEEIIVQLCKRSVAADVISLADDTYRIGTVSFSREHLLASGGESIFWKNTSDSRYDGGFVEDDVCEQKTEVTDVVRVISLFSGAGMLDYPFSVDKHFDIVFAAEYDPDAVKTYRENIGEHVHCVDIRTLTGKELPEADLVIGGPPCQPFSNANRHDGARYEKHEESDMLRHVIRLIRECFAKAFVIENVPGLISERDGFYMKLLEDSLQEYDIVPSIVTDCELGGFTKRKRAILIGSRIGKPVIPDFIIRPFRTVSEALKRVDDDWPNAADITQSSELVRRKIAMIPEGGNWRDLPAELWTKSVHSNMYRRLDRNQPSVAIANWRKYLLSPPKWDDSGRWDRVLSVSEAAALQGLKKEFVFCGSINSKQQQVANGVTYAIGHFIRELVRKLFNPPVVLSCNQDIY